MSSDTGASSEGSGRRVACVSPCVILGDVVRQLGGSRASYRTTRADGGYVCKVKATIVLGGRFGCTETVRAKGRVAARILAAKESAAGNLIRELRVRHGVCIRDTNWGWSKRARRRLARARSAVDDLAGRNSRLGRSLDALTLESCQLRGMVGNLVEKNRSLTDEAVVLESERQSLEEKVEILQAGWRRTLEDFSSIQSSMVLGVSLRLASGCDLRHVAAQSACIENRAKEMIDEGFRNLDASVRVDQQCNP